VGWSKLFLPSVKVMEATSVDISKTSRQRFSVRIAKADSGV